MGDPTHWPVGNGMHSSEQGRVGGSHWNSSTQSPSCKLPSECQRIEELYVFGDGT